MISTVETCEERVVVRARVGPVNDPRPGPELVVASAAEAAGMVQVIHAAFGSRPALDPPSSASAETTTSVAAALNRGAGVYAHVAGRPAGAVLVGLDPRGFATLSRVSVHPDYQRHGIASDMVRAAEDLAAMHGMRRVELFAREELAELIAFWMHRGFHRDRSAPHGVVLTKTLPAVVTVPTAADMLSLGAQLAVLTRAGDMLVLSGDLGAGKTTLTQGLGAGLGVATPVVSPTFVLSRIHRSATGHPGLVHVDAYRLGGADELADLDLEASAADAVTVVEWGRGLVESGWPDRLEIEIVRHDGEGRSVLFRPVGRRWSAADLTALQRLGGEPDRAAGG